MPRHVGSGNAELCDLRQPVYAQRSRPIRRKIIERPHPKIRWKPLEVGLPYQARTPVHIVAGCAVANGAIAAAGLNRFIRDNKKPGEQT